MPQLSSFPPRVVTPPNSSHPVCLSGREVWPEGIGPCESSVRGPVQERAGGDLYGQEAAESDFCGRRTVISAEMVAAICMGVAAVTYGGGWQ